MLTVPALASALTCVIAVHVCPGATRAGSTARCAEAIFYRREERVVCTGQLAEIEQGCDRVRGPKIIFHLGSERLEVEGGADVQIRPDAPGCGVAATAGGPSR